MMLLLELDWLGSTLRYTTSQYEVTILGVLWLPGLNLASVDLHGTDAINYEIQDDRDWAGALLAARGAPSAPTRVYWSDGTQLVGLGSGRSVAGAVGGQGTGISWRLERRTVPGTQYVPDPAAAITPDAWPVDAGNYGLDQNLQNTPYPIVYGYPGIYGSYGGEPIPGPATPAYLCQFSGAALEYQNSALVVAGTPVEATEVRIHQVSGGSDSIGPDPIDVVPVEQIRDNLGNLVSIVRATDMNQVVLLPGGEYWADWTPDRGGGLVDPVTLTAIRTGDRVFEDVLHRGRYPVSLGKSSSLAWLFLDFVLTEPQDAIDWVETNLSSIGVGVFRDETGFYAKIRDPDAPPVYTLAVDGETIIRTSDLAWPAGPGFSEIQLDFCLLQGEQFVRRVRLVAEADNTDGVAESACAQAFRLYGRELLQIQAPWLYDASTAQILAQRLAKIFCLPGPSVELDVSDTTVCLALARLGAMATVSVTDGGPDPVGWGTRTAWVERATYTPAGCSVVLLFR